MVRSAGRWGALWTTSAAAERTRHASLTWRDGGARAEGPGARHPRRPVDGPARRLRSTETAGPMSRPEQESLRRRLTRALAPHAAVTVDPMRGVPAAWRLPGDTSDIELREARAAHGDSTYGSAGGSGRSWGSSSSLVTRSTTCARPGPTRGSWKRRPAVGFAGGCVGRCRGPRPPNGRPSRWPPPWLADGSRNRMTQRWSRSSTSGRPPPLAVRRA